MDPEITVFVNDACVCNAGFRDIYIEIWRKPGSVTQLRTTTKHQLAFAKSRPGGKIASLSIVLHGSVGGIDNEMRKAIFEGQQQVRPFLRAGALVMPTSGFTASIVRGVVAGLALISRATHPTRVCQSMNDATDWIAPHGGPGLSGAQIRHAVEELERAARPLGAKTG